MPTSGASIDRLTLRFRDPAVERAFQEDARPDAARQFRHAILAVALIRTLFTIVALVSRGAAGPWTPDAATLVVFWAAYAFTHTATYERLIRPTVVFCCLSYVALAVVRYLGSYPAPGESAGMPAGIVSLWGLSNLLMLMIFAFVFTRGGFLTANVIAWIAIVAWNVALAVKAGQLFPWGEAYPMYCLAGYVLALLAGRAIESGLRRDFLVRRQDQEYIRNVAIVTEAAQAVEARTFAPGCLDPVAARNDALGQLARTFQRMASEVRAREQRLQQQVEELRVEIDQSKRDREVAEVTSSDYFQRLRLRAAEMRRAQASAADPTGPERADRGAKIGG